MSNPPTWSERADFADWSAFPIWPYPIPEAFRISTFGPCYFNRDGTFRFDPPHSQRDDYGVSYWALEPQACFIEKWGDFSMGIPEMLVNSASLSQWTPPPGALFADMISDPRILGDFGVDLALSHSSRGDYERSQQCGSRLRAGGFDGIVWTVRHDPAGLLRGLAIFGPAHPADEDRPGLFPGVKTDSIPEYLINDCEDRFHLRVLPSTPLS